MLQSLNKSLPEALHFFRKNDPNEKETQWFKPNKIFGGEHSGYQEEQGINSIQYGMARAFGPTLPTRSNLMIACKWRLLTCTYVRRFAMQIEYLPISRRLLR